MRERVFIVWGGNRPLAERVAEALKTAGYDPQVGGGDDNPLSDDGFLGKRVIEQMKGASRAIILAQYQRKQGRLLRPNLLFEWGFLAARLPASYLHVYLIGLRRTHLHSDVLGSWATEVQSTAIPQLTKDITKHFLQEVHHARPEGTQVFMHWHDQYRAWLADQATGRAAPNDHMLAGVLIHSLQPAFYADDLDVVRKVVQNASSGGPRELSHALVVVDSALRYYEETDKDPAEQSHAALEAIRQTLATHPPWISVGNPIHRWLEVFRLDFYGLCLQRLALGAPTRAARRRDLQNALDSFCETQALLTSQSPGEEPYLRDLWVGYVLRNLGRTEGFLGLKRAGKTLERALKARRNALGYLSLTLPKYVAAELALETTLVDLDLASLRRDDTKFARKVVASATKVLLDKSVLRRLSLWRRVQKQLEELTVEMKLPLLPQALRSSA